MIITPPFKDLTGKRFNRLLVLSFVGRNMQGIALWMCLCDCGTIKIIVGSHLVINGTNSCGCYQKERVSEVNRGKIISEEHKLKLSISKMGELNPAKRPEVRKKMSDSAKKHPPNSLGHKPSTETLLKMSISRKGKCVGELNSMKRPEIRAKVSGRNNGMYGKPSPHGAGRGKGAYFTKTDGVSVYLRSTYETMFAIGLEQNEIIWKYENRFDLGDCTYLPDFYLPEYDLYIEVKGWLSKKAYGKLIKFSELYPNIKLVVFELNDIKKFIDGSKLEHIGIPLNIYLSKSIYQEEL